MNDIIYLKQAAYDEIIAETEASLQQLRRTCEGLKQRIEAEERQLQMFRVKRKMVAQVSESSREEGVAEQIAKLLFERREPMRAAEIMEALDAFVSSAELESKSLNSIVSALNRRSDLFEKVARGVYTLRQPVEERAWVGHLVPR